MLNKLPLSELRALRDSLSEKINTSDRLAHEMKKLNRSDCRREMIDQGKYYRTMLSRVKTAIENKLGELLSYAD